jgi:hypothetical protein
VEQWIRETVQRCKSTYGLWKGAKVSHNDPWCRVTGTGDGSSGAGRPRRSPERPADRLRRPLVHLVDPDASVGRGKYRSQSESLR